MKSKNDLLIKGLTFNAVFSSVSALAMLLAADWVAAQIGLPGPANVYAVAIFLVFFAAQLANIVRTGKIRSWEIAAIIVADLLWVIGSVALGARYYRDFTAIGAVLVDVIAMAVLIFAIMQMRGLLQYRRSTFA